MMTTTGRAMPSRTPAPIITPLGAAQADLTEIERIVKAAGTSFYRGMRILPPDRRAAMYAIYAFCRLVDDIADEPAPLDQKRRELAAWRARIVGLSRGVTSDDIPSSSVAANATTRVLLPAMRQFGLREADFLAVIDGMATDAETLVVAPTEAELDLYCDQVASAVGRLSVRAFGASNAAADQVAWHLGRALQLTNILRDLGEDAARGRLYLPREWLLAADVPCEPLAALESAGLPSVCRRASRKAHAHFKAANSAMLRCNRQAMRPARLMAANYRALLSELDRQAWEEPAVRISLPWWRKLMLAAQMVIRTL
jgi:phytoene synthase